MATLSTVVGPEEYLRGIFQAGEDWNNPQTLGDAVVAIMAHRRGEPVDAMRATVADFALRYQAAEMFRSRFYGEVPKAEGRAEGIAEAVLHFWLVTSGKRPPAAAAPQPWAVQISDGFVLVRHLSDAGMGRSIRLEAIDSVTVLGVPDAAPGGLAGITVRGPDGGEYAAALRVPLARVDAEASRLRDQIDRAKRNFSWTGGQ